ncbi:kinase-like domain-containing protein [Chaetomium strumarium]|uniref:Kinase-like domain-containing protein n=1 Tax=Chaetomium strumarium TaxID=1170767 RepID=A0AAJ0LYZ6_9PEZI|nr:kinase-like domain-containing protein [Chaetomium strumarium]
MGHRAFPLSAGTLSLRLRSLYQRSNSPLKAARCSQSHRAASMSSVSTPTSGYPIGQQSLHKGLHLNSSLDKWYVIHEVLSERPAAGRVWCVYRATHEGKQFILKDIIPGDFGYILSLQKHVEHSPHVRIAVDSIPERHVLVFPYLEKGLLHIDAAALSSTAKKGIIRDALSDLADLHDKHIIHTDIKPTNIMMNSLKQENGDFGWCNVQITDVEAAVILPPKAKGLTDRLSGNHFWRSPEAWARGIQNTPSDIYSFAIVAIFAWTGRMVFFSDEANRAPPQEQADLILRQHLSFFASDMEDFEGFIAYHGGDDNPFVKHLKELLCTFNEEQPRLPFGR